MRTKPQWIMLIFISMIAFAGTMKGGEPRKLTEVARLKTDRTRFNDLVITKKGDMLIAQPVIGETEAWDLQKKERVWTIDMDGAPLRLSDDEAEVLWVDTGSDPAQIVHSDVRTGRDRKRRALDAMRGILGNCEFGWGPKPVLAAFETFKDGTQIVIFSFVTGKLLSRFDVPADKTGKEPETYGLAVSSDCKHVLIATGGAILMTNEQGKVLHRWETAVAPARLRILPDNQRAVGAGVIFGSPIYSIDLTTGKMAERKEHRYGAGSLEISADGQWCVSGGLCRFAVDRNYYLREHKSEGGAVILWNATTMRPAAMLNPAVDCIKGVAISSDAQWLVAAESGDTEGQFIVLKVDSTP